MLAQHDAQDLVPAKIQKVVVGAKDAGAAAGVVYLELFAGGRRALVVGPGVTRLDDAVSAPESRDATVQGLLRKELMPGIISAIDDDEGLGITWLRVSRPGDEAPSRALVVERDARDPRWLLLAQTGAAWRILCAVPGARPRDGRDTRRGQPYVAPAAPPAAQVAPSSTPPPRPDLTRPRPALKVDLDRRLRGERDRVRRLIAHIESDLRKHGDPDAIAADGEALKAALGTVERGAREVAVVDFATGETRALPLDPARSASENLERIFARARRARAARRATAPRLADAGARLTAVEQARATLSTLDDDDHARALVDAIFADARAAPAARRQAAKAGARLPWRCFRVSEGVLVRVGRGAKDNDALRRASRGNDVWLHARDRRGGHVVVPAGPGPIPPDVLLDAAHLAAWFSAARDERHVDVQHCRVKQLRSPGAGAPAGLVLVPDEQVLHLRVDVDRVARLLRAEVPAAG